MKKNTKLCIVIAAVATTLFASCQQESDEILGNINGLDYRAYSNSSYTGMWDLLWQGYNQNYVGWETETIDWDEVNAVTRPQLVALDEKYNTLCNQNKLDDVTGNEIAKKASMLFHSAFDSLHDGHTAAMYRDRYTHENDMIYPNELRLKQRKDYNDKLSSIDKSYYTTTGDIAPGKISVFVGNMIARDILIDSILPQMKSDAERLEPISQEEYEYKQRLMTCIDSIQSIDIASKDNIYVFAKNFKDYVFDNAQFTEIKQKYGLYQFNFNFPYMQMFITKDNIAYFWLSSFLYWPGQVDWTFDNKDVYTKIYNAFYDMINYWHDRVYQLHNEGNLKGVILDVRGNGGGSTDNLKYFAGLLFKGDNFQIGTCKRKNGIGRLDYTVPTPYYFPCLGTNSEDITEPIAILTNSSTGSCAEFSTVAVKLHDNGISIGTRTMGAGATLWDAQHYTQTNYSGIIGIMGETAVWAYIPECVTYYDGGIGNIESKGITPDIEVPYELRTYEETGRDTQFERALEYIRTGK